MKLIIKIMAICFLSFLHSISANAQWVNTIPTINTSIGNTIGIGNYFAVPNPAVSLLDVDGGDINTGRNGITDQNGYQIGHNYVLWHNGDIHDIFVGVGANDPAIAFGSLNFGTSSAYNTVLGYGSGNQLHTSTGLNNTFIGAGAGAQATSTPKNVFVGFQAGFNQTVYSGTSVRNNEDNTFVGWQAGWYNDGSGTDEGSHNSYFGDESGKLNHVGNYNTYIGAHSGSDGYFGNFNSTVGGQAGNQNNGNNNTFLGYYSGKATTNPSSLTGNYDGNNTFIGFWSGSQNYYGYQNIFIGANAQNYGALGANENNLHNAIAIGANTIVPTNNQMILGNNDITGVGIGLSGDNTTNSNNGPQEKLEINAVFTGTFPSDDHTCTTCNSHGGEGWSGLRFRDLTSASAPCATTFTSNVLSLDDKGNVVLIPGAAGGVPFVGVQNALSFDPLGSGKIEWGGSNPGEELLHQTEVQMVGTGHVVNEWSIYFSGQTSMTNPAFMGYDPVDIGIGYTLSQPLKAKLDVISITNPFPNAPYSNRFAGQFINAGIYSENGGLTDFAGVNGACIVTHMDNKAKNIGGDFYAARADYNIGARGTALPMGSFNIGVVGNADVFNYIPQLGSYNVGVYGVASTMGKPTPAKMNIGVYGDLFAFAPVACATPPCNPPGAGTAPDCAGYFDGDLAYTCGLWNTSDANLKDNIEDITNPMDIISQLNPKSYTFRRGENESMILPSGTQFGLLAQDVYNVLPQLTKDLVHPARYDSTGNLAYEAIEYKSVNYIGLVPFLIAAVKEQQTQIAELQAANSSHHVSPTQSSDGEQGQDQSKPETHVDLTSQDAILYQNNPNPFGSETKINYYLPQNVGSAKMIFMDEYGQVIKETELNDRGNASVVVNSENLANGIYSYSLVVNGNVKDTKKMVRSK
jgi:hypothetical protein